MNWREYFNNCDEETEEMYQAFKERLEDEAHGDVLEHTPEELREMQECKDEEWNYIKYEEEEMYRKRYAKMKRYKFKPRPYDPKKKYK